MKITPSARNDALLVKLTLNWLFGQLEQTQPAWYAGNRGRVMESILAAARVEMILYTKGELS